MTALVELALCNLAMAALLAIAAAAASRCLHRPALSHALWLLVFIKLVTPPLIAVPVLGRVPEVGKPDAGIRHQDAPGSGQETVVGTPAEDGALADRDLGAAVDLPAVDIGPEEIPPEPRQAAAPPPPPEIEPPDAPIQPPVAPVSGVFWLNALQAGWLAGTAGLFLLATLRTARFRHIVRLARPAADELVRETQRLAKLLHVRCPQVMLLDGVAAPMVWLAGWQGRLLLPAQLLGRLSFEQRAALLAHELAHLRRGDPWVRLLEIVVVALYWWCPLVWWARQELHEAEEECCDAWALWAVPGAARAYALALVETVDFLADARPRLPALASGFGHVSLLRRRLTMIMRGKTPRALSVLGGIAVLAVAALALPLLPGRAAVAQEPQAQDKGQDQNQNQNQDQKENRKRERDREQKQRDAAQKEVAVQTKKLRAMAEKLQAMREQLEEERQALRDKQMQLEKHFHQLHDAMQKLGVPPPNPRRAGGQPGSGQPRQEPQPERGRSPDGRGRPGQPGAGYPGGPAGGGGPGNLEQRLANLERVLQHLLHEVSDLRRELGPGRRGPRDDGRRRERTDERPGRPGQAPLGGPGGAGISILETIRRQAPLGGPGGPPSIRLPSPATPAPRP